MDDMIAPEVAELLAGMAVTQRRDAVLDELEARAERDGFPIVGRTVGSWLELLTRAVGARRVCELGSGFGYSAWFLAGAVGDDGELICTEGDADNARIAEAALRRAGRWGPVRWHTGDALEVLQAQEGELDVVFCDIDKHDYPRAFALAAERLRVGGLWLCDNVLWDGRVPGMQRPADPGRDAVTDDIRRLLKDVTDDGRFLTGVLPVRDGLQVALRVA